jgi:hypothetical protein
MGTDIHGVVEEQVSPGRWVAIRTLDRFIDEDGKRLEPACLVRNYRRFDALAGARGNGPAPRGLPDDASETARHLFETVGDHSASWLPLDEASLIFAQTDFRKAIQAKLADFVAKPDGGHNVYYFSEIGDGENYRLVFWFDS